MSSHSMDMATMSKIFQICKLEIRNRSSFEEAGAKANSHPQLSVSHTMTDRSMTFCNSRILNRGALCVTRRFRVNRPTMLISFLRCRRCYAVPLKKWEDLMPTGAE
jgi:hypothetical protein